MSAQPGILIVDDDTRLLKTYKRLLGKLPVTLFTAPTPDEGLAILDAHADAIQAVVSDFRMPGMDGVQFLIEVRARQPHCHRVMVSSSAPHEPKIREAMSDGTVQAALGKPARTADLRALVSRVLLGSD